MQVEENDDGEFLDTHERTKTNTQGYNHQDMQLKVNGLCLSLSDFVYLCAQKTKANTQSCKQQDMRLKVMACF